MPEKANNKSILAPLTTKSKTKKYFFGKITLKILLSFLAFFKYIFLGIATIFEVLFKGLGFILNSFKKLFGVQITKKNSAESGDNKSVSKKPKYRPDKTSKSLLAAKEQLLLELQGDNKRSSEAEVYRVTAKNPNGKIRTETMSGFSKQDINAFLVNEGYEVYRIESSDTIKFVFGKSTIFFKKLSGKNLIFWLTQLATYVKAGIPLTEALRILAKQMGKNGIPNRTFSALVYELTMGNSFSTAMEKQGKVFPSLLINMIRAAEATGQLEETLDDMANYYDEINKTKKQMISAMIYPSMILIFAVGVITFIMLFIIPQFVQVFDSAGAEIKGITLFILNLSNFLQAYIVYIILGALMIVVLLYLAYKRVKEFRRAIQILLMKSPVIGKVIIYNEMAIFTKTFASLLKNNVFITDSIDILIQITNNEIYKQLMMDTISNIAKGEKISTAFEDHWAVPDVAYYMIVTGESTGELASMMSKVSTYYQEQHRNIVNTLKSLVEPIMIVFLAVIVGVVVLSIVMPMFDLYDTVDM